jgi:hypothetical protein
MRSPCCLCIFPIVARQRLSKHVSAATNTQLFTLPTASFYLYADYEGVAIFNVLRAEDVY